MRTAIAAADWPTFELICKEYASRIGVSYDSPEWHALPIVARAVRSGEHRHAVQEILRALDIELDVVDCATIGFLDRVQDYFAAHPADLEDRELVQELVGLCLTHNQLKVLDWLVAAAGSRIDIDWTHMATQAVNSGQAASLAYAVAHGADVNARREAGAVSTILHHQAKHGRKTLVAELLGHGADPDARDSEGRTPLHRVAATGFGKGLIELLLDAGADPQAVDGQGRTPLDHAEAARRQTAFELLRERLSSD